MKKFEVSAMVKGEEQNRKIIVEAETKAKASKAVLNQLIAEGVIQNKSEVRLFPYVWRAPKQTREEKIYNSASPKIKAMLKTMIAAMEPAILEAIRRERKRNFYMARDFIKAVKANVGVTLHSFCRDHVHATEEQLSDRNTWSHREIKTEYHTTRMAIMKYLDFKRENNYSDEYLKSKPIISINKDAVKHTRKFLNTQYRYMLTMKLAAAWIKYVPDEVASLKHLKCKQSPKGFVANVAIGLEDKSEINFTTQCVGAGGHTIQEFHYRYLTHVKGEAA